MAIGDPFSTTYAGSFEAGTSLGKGIQSTTEAFSRGLQEQQKRKRTLDILKQTGILTEKPITSKDFEEEARKQGVTDFKISAELPEEDKISTAEKLFKGLGLPIPKSKGTTFNWDEAVKAGMQFNESTGELVFAPKRPEKTFAATLAEAAAAKEEGLEYKGGKVQTPGMGMGGFGAATIAFAEKNAPNVADAVESGDFSALALVDKRTASAAIRILRERGFTTLDEAALGYKAEQSASANARVQDTKVNAAISAQTLLDSNYDPKTGDYKVPPSQHAELAIAAARLIAPQAVTAQQQIEELRQRTAREGLAGIGIWLGFDPKELGGSTQSVINMFAKTIQREGLAAERMRDAYVKGGRSSFKEMLEKPITQRIPKVDEQRGQLKTSSGVSFSYRKKGQ